MLHRICLNAQFHVKKTMLTIKAASAIRKVIVCDNGCFNMLGCSWCRHIIYHFRLVRSEKAMSYLSIKRIEKAGPFQYSDLLSVEPMRCGSRWQHTQLCQHPKLSRQTHSLSRSMEIRRRLAWCGCEEKLGCFFWSFSLVLSLQYGLTTGTWGIILAWTLGHLVLAGGLILRNGSPRILTWYEFYLSMAAGYEAWLA